MRLVLLLLLASSLHAAPIPKAQPAAMVPNYFPCELYTRWEYECGKGPVVVEVTKVRHEMDCKIVTQKWTWTASGASIDRRFRVAKEAVYSLEEDRQAEGEMVVLKVGAKPGDK